MKNILFSGVDKIKGFTDEQAKVLQKDVNNNSNIAFISSYFDDFKRNDEQFNRFLELFKEIRIIFNSSFIIDSRINRDYANEIITNSDVVFLMGGSPELQMKFINDCELSEPISNSKFV